MHDVELMKALVEQNATALPFPSSSPSTTLKVGLGTEPVGHDPNDAHEITQFPTLHEFSNLFVTWLDPQLEHAPENLIRLFLRLGDQPLGVGLVSGNWFFHHDVKSGVQSLDSKRGVLKMRSGDHQGIDLTRGDQGIGIAVDFYALFLVLL